MATEDPSELDDIDRQIRINELQQEAEELAGGKLVAWESNDCPAELAELFWRSVVEYEKAPLTCHFQMLIDSGIELPHPETLTGKELTAKLSEIVSCLAGMRVFVTHTDHLSDRELYAHLWLDTLREVTADLPLDDDSAYHIDILGGCSEEDIYLQMKHYADEEERRDWLLHFPDYQMPAHEDPPYDRDQHLPRSMF